MLQLQKNTWNSRSGRSVRDGKDRWLGSFALKAGMASSAMKARSKLVLCLDPTFEYSISLAVLVEMR